MYILILLYFTIYYVVCTINRIFDVYIIGILYKYYKDYSKLEIHFKNEHYLCDDPLCLEKKFVVFPNSIDLAAHNRYVYVYATSMHIYLYVCLCM